MTSSQLHFEVHNSLMLAPDLRPLEIHTTQSAIKVVGFQNPSQKETNNNKEEEFRLISTIHGRCTEPVSSLPIKMELLCAHVRKSGSVQHLVIRIFSAQV